MMPQILRKDFLSQQRQWEDDLARSAPHLAAASDEGSGDEVPTGSSQEGRSEHFMPGLTATDP